MTVIIDVNNYNDKNNQTSIQIRRKKNAQTHSELAIMSIFATSANCNILLIFRRTKPLVSCQSVGGDVDKETVVCLVLARLQLKE